MPTSSEVVGIVSVVVVVLSVLSRSGFLLGSFILGLSNAGTLSFSVDSVLFLSPEVSNGVVEEGESDKLEADVDHLELIVEPEGIEDSLGLVNAFGTPGGVFGEVVVALEGSIVVINKVGDAGSEDGQEDAGKLPDNEDVSNPAEDDEHIRGGEEGGAPEESSNEPDNVVRHDTEHVDGVEHALHDESEAVVVVNNVLSVDQITVVSHVSEDEETVHGPGPAANLFGGPFATVGFRRAFKFDLRESETRKSNSCANSI